MKKSNLMKKGIAGVLISVMAVATLAGCGSGSSSSAGTSAAGGTSTAAEAASTAESAADAATTAAESASAASSEAATEAASDDDELAKIQAAGKIVVGVEGTYPPFTYHDADGNLTGMDVEVAEAVADKLGVQADFVESAWDSLLIGIDSGRLDTVINAVSITDERKEKYDFSDPYYYEARRVVVRSDDDSIKTPADLKGKKIATNTTNAFIPWYEAQGAEVVGIDTSAEAVEMLLSKRVDFIGTSVPVLNAYLDEHPDAKDKVKEAFVIPNSEDQIAIPIRKGEPRLLAAINDALSQLRSEGKLKEISEKYLGGDYTNPAQ